jgi:predicted nucleic acid-binding protein
MIIYLLDTNAVSEAVKSRQNIGYMSWLNSTDDSQMYISCLTIGEIQKGISLTSEAKLRSKLDAYLAGLYEAFSGRIVDVDINDCVLWGNLTAKAQQSGKTSPMIDTLIAAQSMKRNMTLVTRNTKDFEQFSDLELLSPWT